MRHNNYFYYICSMLDTSTWTYEQINYSADARNCSIETVRGEQITYTVVAAKD